MGAKDLQQRAALVKLGKELQELMGLDPPINVKAKSPQLKAQIAEAASNLSTEEGDADKLSEAAIETLKTIGCEDDLIRIGAIEAPKTPKKGPKSKKVKEEEPEDEDEPEEDDEPEDVADEPDEDEDEPEDGDEDEPDEDADEDEPEEDADEEPDEDEEEPPAKAKKSVKKPPKKAAKVEEDDDEDEDGDDEPDEEPEEDEEPPPKKSPKKVKKEEAPAKKSKDAGKKSDEPGKKKSKRKGGKKSRYSRIEAAFAVLNDKPKMPLEKAIQAADDFYTKHCDRGSNMKEAKRQTQRVVRIFELLGMRPDNHTSS